MFSEVLENEGSNSDIFVHDMHLKMHPTIDNNETSVQCIALVDSETFSETARLIVQGKCC